MHAIKGAWGLTAGLVLVKDGLNHSPAFSTRVGHADECHLYVFMYEWLPRFNGHTWVQKFAILQRDIIRIVDGIVNHVAVDLFPCLIQSIAEVRMLEEDVFVSVKDHRYSLLAGRDYSSICSLGFKDNLSRCSTKIQDSHCRCFRQCADPSQKIVDSNPSIHTYEGSGRMRSRYK